RRRDGHRPMRMLVALALLPLVVACKTKEADDGARSAESAHPMSGPALHPIHSPTESAAVERSAAPPLASAEPRTPTPLTRSSDPRGASQGAHPPTAERDVAPLPSGTLVAAPSGA